MKSDCCGAEIYEPRVRQGLYNIGTKKFYVCNTCHNLCTPVEEKQRADKERVKCST